MKKCRVLHINDGNSRELTNGNSFFAEHEPKTEQAINKLMEMGYEVKQMVPQYSPSIQGNSGSFTFYLSGYSYYLEKEFTDDENDDEEFEKLFSELNPVNAYDDYDPLDEDFDLDEEDDISDEELIALFTKKEDTKKDSDEAPKEEPAE